MKYLLIFDLRGDGASRKRLNRYLRRVARRRQYSVWELADLPSLFRAFRLVKDAGGKAIAFVESNQIPLDQFAIRQDLANLEWGRPMSDKMS